MITCKEESCVIYQEAAGELCRKRETVHQMPTASYKYLQIFKSRVFVSNFYLFSYLRGSAKEIDIRGQEYVLFFSGWEFANKSLKRAP